MKVHESPITASREQLERWDVQHYWHSFTQMGDYRPLIIERAEGCSLVDLDGNRYLDGVSSLWCNLVGHRHPRLDAAIRDQLDKIAHCTSLGVSNPTTIALARRLAEVAPSGLEHVFFSDDGATAVEAGLKIAFQYWQQCPSPQPKKTKYVALGDAYHGDTIGGASLGGVQRFHALFEPLLFDVMRLPCPDSYRLPPDVTRENACAHYLAQAEAMLAEHHKQIAAFVIEPLVQGAAGMVMHPPGYLRGIRELTQKYHVLLIADEVAVGMGRTGTLWACEQEAVVPDILCLAKGLTGGYLPLAATIATEDVFAAFWGTYAESKHFYHGHTYGGNPLGASVALATLDVLRDDEILESLPPKIGRIGEHLSGIAEHAHVGDIRQRGMIAAIELVRDKETKAPYAWEERRGHAICDHALTEGVWIRPLGNVIIVMPPLTISLEEIDQIMGAIDRGIELATREESR